MSINNDPKFAKGNAMLGQARLERLGAWGRNKQAQIDKQRDHIAKLERTPITSMRDARILEKTVNEANANLQKLEHEMSNPDVLEMNQYNRQHDLERHNKFASIQSGNLKAEKQKADVVNAAYGNMAFDGTFGQIPDYVVKRQLDKLLFGGDGVSKDENGSTYVDFSFGSSSATYRAILDGEGDIGIIRRGEGHDIHSNGANGGE